MAAVVEKRYECKLFGQMGFPNGVPELAVDVVFVQLFGIEYGIYEVCDGPMPYKCKMFSVDLSVIC